MPRETVLIDVSCPFPFIAGATLLAKIAYPKTRDAFRFWGFMWALCRWRVTHRIEKEPELGTCAQPIIPAAFLPAYDDYVSAFGHGQKQLRERLVATQWIIRPHLNAIYSGRVEDINGKYPSINWLSEIAVSELGWKGKKASISTLKSKVWPKCRPVCHAVEALISLYVAWCDETGQQSKAIPSQEFVELLLDSPRIVQKVVEGSEKLQIDICKITRFKSRINEEELVHFVIHSGGDNGDAGGAEA